MLPALNITQGELAVKLGVSRRTTSEKLHEKNTDNRRYGHTHCQVYQYYPAKLSKHAANARYMATTATNTKAYAQIERVPA